METPATRHPLAVEHLPSFIVAPGQTDILFNFVIVFMVVAIFTAGILYMRLHALPEHLAHRTQKVQFEIVAVLGLIALFTHSRIFWIAALLLAMIDLPDIVSPLRSMAGSLRRMAVGGDTPKTIETDSATAESPDKGPGTGGEAVPPPDTAGASIESVGDDATDKNAATAREGAS